MSVIKKNKGFFFIFTLSIVGIIFSYFSYRSSIEHIERENFKESLREHTKIKLESTKNHISDTLYDLNATAQLIQKYDTIWDSKVQEILAISNKIDIFDFTAVADQEGKGYDSSGVTFDISDEEYFQTAIQGTIAFSEVQSSKAMPGKNIIVFVCPMWSEERQVSGVVLGVMNLENLNKTIANNNMETEGNLYIVDSNGNYIGRFQPKDDQSEYVNFWDDLEVLTLKNKEISEIKADFKQRKEGEFSFCNHGHNKYGCYMPIGTHNWQIVYTLEDTEVGKTLNTIFFVNTKHAVFVGICYAIWMFCIIWYFRKTNNEIKQAHHEISKNIDILHIALKHSKHPIFEYDQELRELTVKTDFPNPLFQGITSSISTEHLVEKNIIATQSVASFMQLFDAIKIQQDAKADIQINNGTEIMWCRISLHNIYEEETIVGTVGFVEDITELKKFEEQTKKKLELQETLIAKALLYVKVDMETDHLVEINGEESQSPFDEFLQQKVISYVRPEDKKYILQELSLDTLRDKLKQGIDTIETQFMMDFGGTMKWVSCMEYCNAVTNSKLILIINDIDEKKRKEIALQYQAERDGLTGVYNATTSRTKIQEALSSGYLTDEKQMFILLDLDNYKLINDSFGHSCGDQVLVEVAKILKKRFRSSDIVGRMGGDEFVILLRNMRSYRQAELLVKELCEMIQKTYAKDGKKVTLSASIGIALAPKDGHTFMELYKKSDEALYQVKKQGKNSYSYYEEFEKM